MEAVLLTVANHNIPSLWCFCTSFLWCWARAAVQACSNSCESRTATESRKMQMESVGHMIQIVELAALTSDDIQIRHSV